MARLVGRLFIRRICARELVAQRTIKDDPRTALVNWSREWCSRGWYSQVYINAEKKIHLNHPECLSMELYIFPIRSAPSLKPLQHLGFWFFRFGRKLWQERHRKITKTTPTIDYEWGKEKSVHRASRVQKRKKNRTAPYSVCNPCICTGYVMFALFHIC